MNQKILFLSFWLGCFVHFSFGQPGLPVKNYVAHIKYISKEKGLSHQAVYTTFKDSRGFIWFGTQMGLNRYDGSKIEIFTREADGLAANQVNKIVEDDSGWLWVFNTRSVKSITNFQHLSFVNIYTLEVKTVEERFGEQFPVAERELFDCQSDENKTLYLTTANGPLLRYRLSEGFSQANDFGGTRLVIEYLSAKENQILLKGDENRLMETDTLFQIRWSQENFDKNILTKDTKGRFWLRKNEDLTNLQELKFFTLDNTYRTAPVQIDENKIPPHLLHYQNKKLYYQSNTDIFWYVDKQNTFVFHPQKGILYDFDERYPEITGSQVNHIFFEDDDLVWIASSMGVFKVQLKENPYKKYFAQPEGTYNVNTATSVRGMIVDNQKLWICDAEGIVSRVDLANSEHVTFPEFKVKKNALNDTRRKLSILRYKEGELLFGGVGLGIYDPNKREYRVLSSENDPTKSGYIWSLFEDQNKNIWAGLYRDGLYQLKADSDSLVAFKNYNSIEELRQSTVYAFEQWDDKRILLGASTGIYILHTEKGIVDRFYKKGPEGYKIPHETIHHLYRDKAQPNVLWAATGGGGLLQLSIDPDKLAIETVNAFTKDEGLSSNVIYAIYDDGNGHLWMPGNYGFIRFDKSNKTSIAYTERDGIAHHESNRMAHYQAEDGTLYFGGLNGVTSFHPDSLPSTNTVYHPPLQITNFQLYDTEVKKMVDHTARLVQQPSITLAPGTQLFNLEFALLDYTESDQIRYSYQVIGNNEQWVNLDENKLRISGLPYGDYTLNIRGQGTDGQFSTQQLSIPILVLYPIYLKWWFIALAVLLFLGLGVFIFFWRTRALEKSKKVLERTIRERTATIEAQATELRNLDQVKSRFFANVSHELRTPLTLMLAPIENLLEQQQPNNGSLSQLELAQRNGKRLNKMINQILDLTKLESGKLEVHEEPVVWYNLLRNTVANFESLAQRKDILFQFKYKGSASLKVMLDAEKVETILVNLLSNAFKYSEKGNITLSAKIEADSLVVKVADEGRGIHEEDLPHIFNRFYQTNRDGAAAEGGTGIGLALSKELASLMQGELSAHSIWGEGTTLQLILPKAEVVGQLSTEEALELKKNKELHEFEMLEKVQENETKLDLPKKTATILLVEDNDDLRAFVKSLLEKEYNVITAENGQVALDKLPTLDCHLILSDLMMPILDGYQLLSHLKKSDAYWKIPVIMLTARGGMDDKLKALRIGVDDYIHKPFNKEELLARIKNLLKNAAARLNTPSAFSEGEPQGTSLSETTISKEDQIWLKEVENTTKARLDSFEFNVVALAYTMAISDRQLSRKIKMLTGLSVGQYIREIRFDTALRNLESGQATSVKMAAYQVGLKSVKNFSTQFKERYGRSPSDYL